MFTLINKLIQRLNYLPLDSLSTAERQMFNLFQASNLMTESKDEIVATGLVLPAVDVVLWCNDQGVEIGVEVPKEWIRPMYNHGMISGPLLVNGQIVYKAETKVF